MTQPVAVSAVLFVLVVLLLGPLPGWLSRAGWADRSPRTTLAVWQATAATAGVCLVGALLTLAVAPLHPELHHGFQTLSCHVLAGDPLRGLGVAQVAALASAVAAIGWAAVAVGRTFARQARVRRRHRRRVDLLATDRRRDVRVIDHAAPAAYCLPGLRSRIVVTSGLVDLLSAAELAAVLDHERAHARGRHHLVLLPFLALGSALPRVPLARTAHASAARLVEMLADDHARARHGGKVVAHALVKLAEHRAVAAPLPGGVLGAAEGALVARVQRLTRAARPIALWQRALIHTAALGLPVGPVVLLVPCLL